MGASGGGGEARSFGVCSRPLAGSFAPGDGARLASLGGALRRCGALRELEEMEEKKEKGALGRGEGRGWEGGRAGLGRGEGGAGKGGGRGWEGGRAGLGRGEGGAACLLFKL